MSDTRKPNFEEEFREAFDGAEMNPDPGLWDRMNAFLANEEAAKYKRKLIYFRWRVAAAAALLVGVTGTWLLINTGAPDSVRLAQETQSTNAQAENASRNKVPGLNTPIPLTRPDDARATPQNSSVQPPVAANPPKADADNPEKSVTAAQPLADADGKTERSSEPKRRLAEKSPLLANIPTRRNPVANPRERNTVSRNVRTKEADEKTDLLAIQTDVSPTKTELRTPDTKNPSSLSGNAFPVQSLASIRTTNPLRNQHMADYPRVAALLLAKNTSVSTEEASEEIVVDGTDTKKSRWSLGLAFAPGQFDPNLQAVSQPTTPLNTSANVLDQSSTMRDLVTNNQGRSVVQELESARPVGISYNVGINVSYDLTKRISLQSGVQYLYNNSQITTSNYLEDVSNQKRYPTLLSAVSAQSGPENMNADAGGFAFSGGNNQYYAAPLSATNAYPGNTTVAVYNTYQYMSVPVTVRYKIIDRKLGTSIGAGVAADVLVNNTLGNESANIQNATFDSGSGSIYRSVGISALVSARLDYRVAPRYGFFLEPSYRTALTSFTKSSALKSLPYSFGIGMGFRYSF